MTTARTTMNQFLSITTTDREITICHKNIDSHRGDCQQVIYDASL